MVPDNVSFTELMNIYINLRPNLRQLIFVLYRSYINSIILRILYLTELTKHLFLPYNAEFVRVKPAEFSNLTLKCYMVTYMLRLKFSFGVLKLHISY